MKMAIYDPPLCCSSGVCGPTVDPALVKMNEAVHTLKKQGVEVERFNLAQQPREFVTNNTVAALLQKNGNQILPITFLNGELFKTGEYPSYQDLCSALGIKPVEQKTTLKIFTGKM